MLINGPSCLPCRSDHRVAWPGADQEEDLLVSGLRVPSSTHRTSREHYAYIGSDVKALRKGIWSNFAGELEALVVNL